MVGNPRSFTRGLVLLLGVIAVVLGVLLVFNTIGPGIEPVLGFAIALLGIGEVLQALDGRTP